MKNNQAVNLSTLAATGSPLDLVLAEVRDTAKYTVLPARKPRRSELYANKVGGGSTRWHNSTAGNGRLKAGQLRPDELALKAALR
jgi:hypothetical protein